MSYGIQVINNSNITIIDSDYSNYVVYATGTLTGTLNSTRYDYTYDYFITLPNITGVLLFVRSTSNAGDFSIANYGGTLPGATANIVGWQNANYTLEYVVAVPSNAVSAPTSGYGMNIYKADGSLAFSTEYNYAILEAAVVCPYDGTASAYVPTSKNIYFCISLCTYNGRWEYYINIYGDCSDPQKEYHSGDIWLMGGNTANSVSFGQANNWYPNGSECSYYKIQLPDTVTIPVISI